MGRAGLRAIALVAMVLVTSAHVGTFDSFFAGMAGPYRVQVTVRAPGVVPGLAQITVRVGSPDVSRVTTQAAPGNLGTRGAPRPDDAVRVAGDSTLWSSELWLMTAGAYAINVGVEGPAGSGTVTVPFNSVATRRLDMSPALRWLLGGLAVFLVVGLASIIGASARDAILSPGAPLDRTSRRRGRIATVVGGAGHRCGTHGWPWVVEPRRCRLPERNLPATAIGGGNPTRRFHPCAAARDGRRRVGRARLDATRA
ncbi:MAG TPA: hypothetical protein VF178_10450 [Gemmatimonadaceae bacterium]